LSRLDGKVAIITGAGSGIGRASAILFAKEGAKVVVADWITEAGEETVKIIKGAGGEATLIETDVSNTEDTKRMVKIAIDTYGKLNIVFNNAAICPGEPLTESTEENFAKTIAINLKGVWLAMKYAIPEMIKSGGSIINTASVDAGRGHPGLSIYSATKGGVVSMSRTAAVEYGAQNIRVNWIKPGPTKTPLSMSVLKNNPELVKRIEAVTPQGRFGEPEEVAQLALFFASDESSHITGQGLAIDGGVEADGHLY